MGDITIGPEVRSPNVSSYPLSNSSARTHGGTSEACPSDSAMPRCPEATSANFCSGALERQVGPRGREGDRGHATDRQGVWQLGPDMLDVIRSRGKR